MTAFNDLKTDFESYRDEVKADIATLVTKIDALVTATANNGIDPTFLASLTAEIDAAKADLASSVAAVPATPAPVPVTPSTLTVGPVTTTTPDTSITSATGTTTTP